MIVSPQLKKIKLMKKTMKSFHFFFLLHFLVVLGACGQQLGEHSNKPILSSSENRIMKKSDEEWKQMLTPEQYYILREKGTEKPFSGKLLLNKEKGIYTCSACRNPLFTSDGKFDSNCGWPSFDREIKAGNIKIADDRSHGMTRTEIMCAKCGGHLGHIFKDGPTETGKRYCVNSISLEFVPENALKPIKSTSTVALSATKTKQPDYKKKPQTEKSQLETITLGGGCFWCVEAIYRGLRGVLSVESGYAGGETVNPTYKQVSSGTTKHAEVVQIVFDKKQTNLTEMLNVFFTVHDPTTLNQQGPDIGTQYRSVIFFRDDNQKKVAKHIIDELQREKVYNKHITTIVEPFTVFYKAEGYHQNYYQNNKEQPYCRMVIKPKLEKFGKIFSKEKKRGK